MKKILTFVLCTILTFNTISVHASENQTNLEQMSKTDCEKSLVKLTQIIVKKDVESFLTQGGLLEPQCFEDMYNYVNSNTINSSTMSNIVVDFTYPDNSSTGDSVAMLNTKIWYDNNSYNIAYLFEYHIDKNGKIYGYNIWAY